MKSDIQIGGGFLMEWGNIKDKIYPWIKKELTDEETKNDQLIEVDIPIIKFFGDLVIVFAFDKGDCFEIIPKSVLPVNMSEDELYQLSCENLFRDIEFRIEPTKYGGYGILAGGNHEAASLCIGNIWADCSDIIGEDLIISVPARDIVLMVGVSQKKQLEDMKELSRCILNDGEKPLSNYLFLYSKATKNFSIYE